MCQEKECVDYSEKQCHGEVNVMSKFTILTRGIVKVGVSHYGGQYNAYPIEVVRMQSKHIPVRTHLGVNCQ